MDPLLEMDSFAVNVIEEETYFSFLEEDEFLFLPLPENVRSP